MSYFSPLKGINSVFDYTLNNDIQDGLVEYFDWALLEKCLRETMLYLLCLQLTLMQK